MRHPRTLLATIGLTAVAFALTLGSVIFNAATSDTSDLAAAPMASRQAISSTLR